MFDHLLSGLQIDCLELDDPSVGVGHLLVHVDVQHHSTDLGKKLRYVHVEGDVVNMSHIYLLIRKF